MCGLFKQAAAVERLEESKSKIEGLLDWISNIGNENMRSLDQMDHISKANGNLPEDTSAKGLIENDDANGNALQTSEKDFGSDSKEENAASLDLDKQYDRVKVQLVYSKNVTFVILPSLLHVVYTL